MRRQVITLAAALCLTASVAVAQTYKIIEQDTHGITLLLVESVSSPSLTTRRFSTVSIYAWPDLSQDSYGQIFESEGELDCKKRKIKLLLGPGAIRDIQGNQISFAFGGDQIWSFSDGYEAYEKYFCDDKPLVSAEPFRNLDEVKRYYFDWLDRNVPRIPASRP